MDNIDTTLIGTYIKNIRLSKGWSQAKLEYISGISASSISNIEHGHKGIFYNMSIPAIVKIAHALEMSFYDVLNDSGFLSYIGDQQFIIKDIRQRVEETEKLKQKNLFKKI